MVIFHSYVGLPEGNWDECGETNSDEPASYEKKCSPFLVSHFGCSWVGDFRVATVYDVLIDVGEIPLCPLSICSSDTYVPI